MSTGLTHMHDLAASHMRDLQRAARERATRHAVRRGRAVAAARKPRAVR